MSEKSEVRGYSPDWRGVVGLATPSEFRNRLEENALTKYADHFGLTQQDLDGNSVQTSLVQAAVVRDVTRGVIPQCQRGSGAVPFNLMKSEQLVWVIQGVDYLETVTRRERRGTSQEVSIRVARGLYYSPRQFRSKPIEWEETVHADTGLLGLTTKHIYFAGARNQFRVRCDKIAASGPYEDGSGIMPDAQTARPQAFRTKGGSPACNPGRQPGPVPWLSRGIPAAPEIQQQGRGGCGNSKVTWPQQLLRTSRPACQDGEAWEPDPGKWPFPDEFARRHRKPVGLQY